MAIRERWPLRTGEITQWATRQHAVLMLDPSTAYASGELTIHVSAESSRQRDGRNLAHRFAAAVADRPRVVGAWFSQRTTDTLVTVVTEDLDDELEFRLHDIFEALAAELDDPSVGQLFIYDSEHAFPEGERLLFPGTMP